MTLQSLLMEKRDPVTNIETDDSRWHRLYKVGGTSTDGGDQTGKGHKADDTPRSDQ